jgi:hypothetical protein
MWHLNILADDIKNISQCMRCSDANLAGSPAQTTNGENGMATYCTEKFSCGQTEKRVYWLQNKHVHNPAMISKVKRLLEAKWACAQPGGWDVSTGSYQSNQSSPPVGDNAVDLADLIKEFPDIN